MKDTSIMVFPPALIFHRIVTHQLQHTQAVERGIHPRRRIDDKVLARMWISELLRPFISSQPTRTTKGDLFPGLVGDGDHPALG